MAGFGFLFWLVVARLYSASDVGTATSLISATSLIADLSLFGLNSSLIRFVAITRDRDAQVSQALVLVFVTGVTISTLYLFGLPLYAPKLLFVRNSPLYAGMFALFTAGAGLNLLTDSVFIAERKTQYNILVDGLIQGVVKLALPIMLLGLGAYGIVTATGGGYVIAVVASVFFMRRSLGFRFDLRLGRTALLDHVSFSASSYVSSVLSLAPLLVIPLIVLQRMGAADAGYYFVAFQIANLLNAISYAIGEAVFAEGSYDEARLAKLLRRAATILFLVQVPAAALVALTSGLWLKLFGGAYSEEGRHLLTVLALGALAVALNTWASFALKLTQQMTSLILSNVVYAAVTVCLAAVWIGHGLVWIGWAWMVGNLASGVYALMALSIRRRRDGRWLADAFVVTRRLPLA